MGSTNPLGHFEELLLLAVASLGEQDAYGLRIRQHAEAAAQRSIAIGAVYTTLQRMVEKGYVTSWEGDPTPERGGRAKRFYRVEGAGREALRQAERVRWAAQSSTVFGREAARNLR